MTAARAERNALPASCPPSMLPSQSPFMPRSQSARPAAAPPPSSSVSSLPSSPSSSSSSPPLRPGDAGFNPFKSAKKNPKLATWGSFMKKGGMEEIELESTIKPSSASATPTTTGSSRDPSRRELPLELSSHTGDDAMMQRPSTSRALSSPLGADLRRRDAVMNFGAERSLPGTSEPTCIDTSRFPSIRKASDAINSGSLPTTYPITIHSLKGELESRPHPLWPETQLLTRAVSHEPTPSTRSSAKRSSTSSGHSGSSGPVSSGGSGSGSSRPSGTGSRRRKSASGIEQKERAESGSQSSQSGNRKKMSTSKSQSKDKDGKSKRKSRSVSHSRSSGSTQRSDDRSDAKGRRSDQSRLNIPKKYVDAFLEGQGSDADS